MQYDLIDDITIKSVTDKLSDLIPNWSTLIAEKISNEEHWKIYSVKPCTKQIVVNVSLCRVKSQLHRRLFIKIANELLTPVMEEQKKAIAISKQIKK